MYKDFHVLQKNKNRYLKKFTSACYYLLQVSLNGIICINTDYS